MIQPEHGTPVLSGNWGETTWEFFLSRQLPDPSLCTAVGFVAIRDIATLEIVLTLTEEGRGPGIPPKWETPAGHIDPLDPANPDGAKETPEDTGARETYEEAGFVVARAEPFGYRRIINSDTAKYPALAYMPYYWATTNSPLEAPTDPGEPAVGSFSITAARKLARLGMMSGEDLQIIEFGIVTANYALEGPSPHAS
jgi:8-oxo-dGTP pyrophosphatase MutT (NUDIX family)